MKVGIVSSLQTSDLANYHVVCFTENFENIDKLIEANEFCREKGIGFILTLGYGATGLAFVDFGKEFTINDADGEDTKSFIVVNIT